MNLSAHNFALKRLQTSTISLWRLWWCPYSQRVQYTHFLRGNYYPTRQWLRPHAININKSTQYTDSTPGDAWDNCFKILQDNCTWSHITQIYHKNRGFTPDHYTQAMVLTNWQPQKTPLYFQEGLNSSGKEILESILDCLGQWPIGVNMQHDDEILPTWSAFVHSQAQKSYPDF